MKRRSGWRLSHQDKLFLIKILNAFPEEDREVWRLYKLSKATLRRVKQVMPSNPHAYEWFMNREILRSARDKFIVSTLEEVVRPPKAPMTLPIIGRLFKKKTNIDLTRHQLRTYMKNNLRYSYIKGSSRPLKILSPDHIIRRGLFSIKVLGILLGDKIAANYDECNFNRDLMRKFSWLPKGKGGEILNTTILNKTNLSLAVFPNGSWIWFLKDGNITSYDFSIFIWLLSKIMKGRTQRKEARVNFIIDNAKIHHSLESLRAIEFSNFKPIFPSPYSPELLPVELCFKAVKSIVRSFPIINKLDYSSEEGAKTIFRALGMVGARYIQSWWIDAVRKQKESIIAAVEIQKYLKTNGEEIATIGFKGF